MSIKLDSIQTEEANKNDVSVEDLVKKAVADALAGVKKVESTESAQYENKYKNLDFDKKVEEKALALKQKDETSKVISNLAGNILGKDLVETSKNTLQDDAVAEKFFQIEILGKKLQQFVDADMNNEFGNNKQPFDYLSNSLQQEAKDFLKKYNSTTSMADKLSMLENSVGKYWHLNEELDKVFNVLKQQKVGNKYAGLNGIVTCPYQKKTERLQKQWGYGAPKVWNNKAV